MKNILWKIEESTIATEFHIMIWHGHLNDTILESKFMMMMMNDHFKSDCAIFMH